jgi:hypothetical protein
MRAGWYAAARGTRDRSPLFVIFIFDGLQLGLLSNSSLTDDDEGEVQQFGMNKNQSKNGGVSVEEARGTHDAAVKDVQIKQNVEECVTRTKCSSEGCAMKAKLEECI